MLVKDIFSFVQAFMPQILSPAGLIVKSQALVGAKIVYVYIFSFFLFLSFFITIIP